MFSFDEIKNADIEIAEAMQDEMDRQQSHLELIASENIVSKAVMAAMGSHLTNKYAEGYPGKRYYGGCECVDVVEELARERAKELFGCEYANVQPHSGAQANMAVQFAILKPGDTVMGMNLDHGGHLTHGSPVNFSGTYFHIVPYGVNDEGFIDYDKVEEIAMECKPKMIIAGASAYARTIDFKRFREIADACGAVLMVDMAHIAGLVAAGLHPSPIPYAHVVTTTTHKTLRGPRGGMILSSQEIADKYNFNKAIFPGIQGGPLMHVIAAKAVCFKEALQPEFKVYQQNIIDNAQALCKGLLSRDIKIVSGGTDNHLMLVDLTNYDQTGKAVEKLLDSVNITCNKNTIPNDPKSPFVTSGVRLGTPAVTSRGLNTEDMDQIAEAIAQIKDAAAIHAKLKPIHDTFLKKNFKLTKDAYASQHKEELDAFNKAVRTMMKLNGSTTVDFSALDAEFSALQSGSAELRSQLETLQPDISALKNIRKYIDMVLNKQQLSAPGGKTPEKESVLKQLEQLQQEKSKHKAITPMNREESL